MVLDHHILFSLAIAAIAEAILMRTSAEQVPSLHRAAPRYLKLITSSNFSSFMLIPALMLFVLSVMILLFSVLTFIPHATFTNNICLQMYSLEMQCPNCVHTGRLCVRPRHCILPTRLPAQRKKKHFVTYKASYDPTTSRYSTEVFETFCVQNLMLFKMSPLHS